MFLHNQTPLVQMAKKNICFPPLSLILPPFSPFHPFPSSPFFPPPHLCGIPSCVPLWLNPLGIFGGYPPFFFPDRSLLSPRQPHIRNLSHLTSPPIFGTAFAGPFFRFGLFLLDTFFLFFFFRNFLFSPPLFFLTLRGRRLHPRLVPKDVFPFLKSIASPLPRLTLFFCLVSEFFQQLGILKPVPSVLSLDAHFA